MNVGKTTIRNNEIRNNAPVPNRTFRPGRGAACRNRTFRPGLEEHMSGTGRSGQDKRNTGNAGTGPSGQDKRQDNRTIMPGQEAARVMEGHDFQARIRGSTGQEQDLQARTRRSTGQEQDFQARTRGSAGQEQDCQARTREST
jgi:hypothetical protein